jgi:signal transduction histidine kinase
MIRWLNFFAALLLALGVWTASFANTLSSVTMPATPPAQLQANLRRLNLVQHLAWLKDESGTLTRDDVAARHDFVPLKDNLSLGFTNAVVWLRFDLQAGPLAPARWILEVGNALLDDVRLYSPQADGSYVEHRSGENLARSQWEIDYRNPSFYVEIAPPLTQRYYVRLWTRNAVSTAVEIWQPEAFAAATREESFNYGMYYGIYALIFIFSLFFWYWTGERIGGWYAGYVILNCLGAAMSAGYLQRQAGLPGYLSDALLAAMLCLPLAISNTFTLMQLELTSLMPRFSRIYQRVTWVLSIATLLLALSISYGAGVVPAQMASLLCIGILVPIGIWLAWHGHRPARFFLFAFGPFYVAVVLRYLRNLGYLPPSVLTEYGIQMGSLFNMVVISLGITARYNRNRLDMLASQTALSESLEIKVAQRTATLKAEMTRREQQEIETRRALSVEVQARLEQHNFVAMVSHEFRTPLAIINTVTQQLARQLDAPREKSLQRCANIRGATQRMTDMIDEFLSADRVGTALCLNLGPFEPRQFMNALIAEWEGDHLQLTCADLPSSFMGDAALLRVAVRNLIANALKHSPVSAPVRITVHGTQASGLEISVIDQGVGIAEDELPKLFEKYFRGRASQTDSGAGLGLYLAENIATLHGGSVRVQSEVGHGSTFVLAIPELSVQEQRMAERRISGRFGKGNSGE